MIGTSKDNNDVRSDLELDSDDMGILRHGLRGVKKLDHELQLNLDNLMATAPMRENQTRYDAVETASKFLEFTPQETI
ncbi:hypothetical protein PV325_013907 [Microctonus aethiopoides]|nr:hypothetical protein PV325_013907 [Microctonus aethiopoides]